MTDIVNGLCRTILVRHSNTAPAEKRTVFAKS